MIAPLRRAHRRVFVGLALGLPVLAFLGLAKRPDFPAFSARLAAPAAEPAAAGALLAFRGPGRGAEFLRDPPRLRTAFVPSGAPPALLAYALTAGALQDVAPGDDLPRDAVLLGRPSARERRVFDLPAGTRSVVLYSLGHHGVVDVAPLPIGNE